jgi:DNA-binding NarL/FixJ family response regulator
MVVSKRDSRKSKLARKFGILLVDDHPLVRERLGDVSNREKDMTVCGEAEERFQAIDLINQSPPDLAIIDITLKNSDGLELIKDIHARWPKLPMLVVSMHDETLYAERVLRAGARGYITKQEATRNILLAIRRILDGHVYLNERVATQILTRIASPNGVASTNLRPTDMLADRELQVFELTGRGLNPRQIADRLHIGVKTVETYRARIREKLNLKDGTELLQLAIIWTHQQ